MAELIKSRRYDLIVIGSGPGGQKGAIAAAKAGKRVAMIESEKLMGGNCVFVGTLPSKSFRESVYRWSMSSKGALGGKRGKQALPEMKRLLERKDRVVEVESSVVMDQVRRNHIDVIRGKARLVSANEVEVTSPRGQVTLGASFILIATGAHPIPPEHIQVDQKHVFDSNSILSLKKLPKELVVLGGGIIGCEYASMFSMAGTKVYLVDKRHEILASVDREIVDHLGERFVSQGMELILEAEAVAIEKPVKGKSGVRVKLSNGRKISADAVLVALGRKGNTDGLGLESIGLKPDSRGLIAVDKHYRTMVPSVYAVGDVIGAPALASTSMEQGRMAVGNAFQLSTEEMSPFFPYGIYTIPEISMSGLTEEECHSKGLDVVIGRARYKELARGMIVGDQWGLLKLVVDRQTQKLLGVHIIGEAAANLVHIGQAVMALDGDLSYFIRTVFNYPTLAEAYKTAAFDAFNQLRGRLKAA